MRGFNSFILMLIVTAGVYAAVTCIEIEALNCRAGYYLPRTDLDKPGNPKWRSSTDISEEFWKKRHRYGAGDEIDVSPMNGAELAQMKRDIYRGQSENQLHELVETRGLLQYPICVGVLIGCVWFWSKATKKVGRGLVLASAVCSVVVFSFALYRGYFTSLGW